MKSLITCRLRSPFSASLPALRRSSASGSVLMPGRPASETFSALPVRTSTYHSVCGSKPLRPTRVRVSSVSS